MTTEPLTRLSLRDQAHDRLMGLILRNELEAGERINEKAEQRRGPVGASGIAP